jgi:hypothetical protein
MDRQEALRLLDGCVVQDLLSSRRSVSLCSVLKISFTTIDGSTCHCQTSSCSNFAMFIFSNSKKDFYSLMIKQIPLHITFQQFKDSSPELYSLFTVGSPHAMDPSRPGTSYTVSQSLPPITALTNELPPPEPSPGFLRDSGNWSISQSKRKS